MNSFSIGNSIEFPFQYLYTEEVKVRVQDAMAVIYLAQKYDVPKLAEKCVGVLKTKLNTSNAVSIFQKAQFIQEETLVELAKEFICRSVFCMTNEHISCHG